MGKDATPIPLTVQCIDGPLLLKVSVLLDEINNLLRSNNFPSLENLYLDTDSSIHFYKYIPEASEELLEVHSAGLYTSTYLEMVLDPMIDFLFLLVLYNA